MQCNYVFRLEKINGLKTNGILSLGVSLVQKTNAMKFCITAYSIELLVIIIYQSKSLNKITKIN